MGGGAEGRPEGGAAAAGAAPPQATGAGAGAGAGSWADWAEAAVRELEARAARQCAAAEATAASAGATGPARYAAETARRSAAAAATARRAVAGAKKGQQPPLPARPRPVRRVNAGELSLRAFRQELQRANAPVVLEGLGEHLTEDGAAFAELGWLRRCVGNKTVAVSERHAHAKACLDRADYALTTVGELLDAVDAGEAEGRYLYDCSMPLKLPSLLEAVRVPRFFCHDFLQRTRRLHAFSRSWPSLFIAAPGTQSSLHVDQWQGHFWMAMLRGTKRWTVFHPDDVPLLSPDWGRNTLDPAFPALDALDACPAAHPLHRLARRWECDLGPGEVLFVPGGAPHQVKNLDASVAMAGNYVDETNLDRALADLELQAAQQGAGMAETFRTIDEVDFDDAAAEWDGAAGPLPIEHLVVPYRSYASGEAGQWDGPLDGEVLASMAREE